ncbi:MAG: hypothetical protein Q8K11_10700 [Phenylobacterium sp.]|uniref:hypothetical protein n=1 Tax=Phenylobacterium sp. TaxID=1871053 RepID=UPI002731F1C4|nr:hypothetical protein [Phenylobacterium sp.]MDP2010637.1 hypothetical protein [Phenylobacterium sp.]
MPTRPALSRPRGAPTRKEAQRIYDRERYQASATKKLYGTARWQALRAAHLAEEPLCRMCLRESQTTVATVCDHIEPHRGDVVVFWLGPFQSLCQFHHSGEKQRQEAAMVGVGQKSPPRRF